VNKLHVLLPIVAALIFPGAALPQDSRDSNRRPIRDLVRDNAAAIAESEFQLLLTIARLRNDLLTDPDGPLFFEILSMDPEAFGLTMTDLREMRENPFALRRARPELLNEIQRRAESASLSYFVTQSSSPGRNSLGDYDFDTRQFTRSSGTEHYYHLEPVWNRIGRNFPFTAMVSPAPVSVSELKMSTNEAESLMQWMGPAGSDFQSRLTTRLEYRIQRVESGADGGNRVAHIRPLRLRIDAERRKRGAFRSAWGSEGTVEVLRQDLTEAMVSSEIRERRLSRELWVDEGNDDNLNVLGITTGVHTSQALAALDRHFQAPDRTIGVMTPRIWSRVNREPSFLSESTAYQTQRNGGMIETAAIYADPADQASVFYVMRWLQFPDPIRQAERADLISGMIRKWGSDFVRNSNTWIWSRDPAAIRRATAGLESSGIHCLEEIRLTRPSAGRWYSSDSNNPNVPLDIAVSAPALQSSRGGADERIRSACPPLVHVRISEREVLIQLYDAGVALGVKRRFNESVRRQNQNSTAEEIQNLDL
jgi:hypothetical protein